MTNKTNTAVIPFDGFYESVSAQIVDRELEHFFDFDGGNDYNIPDEFYTENHSCDYQKIHEEYSKLYVESFKDFFETKTGIKLAVTFESLQSPREYNYSTDRIFVNISDVQIRKLFDRSEEENHIVLKGIIKEHFTSCDGFASSYPNNLDEWAMDSPETWDHNELSMLILAALDGTEKDTFNIMEDAVCNGRIAGIVENAISQEFHDFAAFQAENGETDFETWRHNRRESKCVRVLNIL